MPGWDNIQNSNAKGEPELLCVGEIPTPRLVLVDWLIEGIRNADENPHAAERGPARITMVAFEPAAACVSSIVVKQPAW